MNCHGKNKEKQRNNNHSAFKHMLPMILCCGLPIVIIGFLPIISSVSPSASRILGIISSFICPIMMLGMFGMIFSDKKSCCNSEKDDIKNKELNKYIE